MFRHSLRAARQMFRLSSQQHAFSQPSQALRSISSSPTSTITSAAPSSTSSIASLLHRTTPVSKHHWTQSPSIIVHSSLTNLTPSSTLSLPALLFNVPPRRDLVHRVVHWQLACRRQGTASTKSRSEVAGSGRKIRPQKGTGRSRQGAITSPIFRGGGRAHGPKPRDWSYNLPKKVRREALRVMLSEKFRQGKFWVVNDIAIEGAKTQNVVNVMNGYEWRSALVVDDVAVEGDSRERTDVDKSFRIASHNVKGVLGQNVRGINVYDMLSFDELVFSKRALDKLISRFEAYEYLY